MVFTCTATQGFVPRQITPNRVNKDVNHLAKTISAVFATILKNGLAFFLITLDLGFKFPYISIEFESSKELSTRPESHLF